MESDWQFATPDEQLRLGEELRDGNNCAAAESIFRSLTERFPDHAAYWFKLGTVHEKLGDLTSAEAAYQRAIELRDSYSEALNNLALLALKRADYDYAESLLRGLLGESPDYFEAHINLGNTLIDTGRAVEAQYHFRRAVGLKPQSVLAHSRLGVALRNRGRSAEAIAVLEHAVTLDPTNHAAWNNLGTCYFERGNHAKADLAFARSIELSPDQTHAWHNWLFLGNFMTIDAKEIYARHVTYGLRMTEMIPTSPSSRLGRRRAGHPRLRLGFVSGDMRRHSVAYFLLSVLDPLQRCGFDLYAYPTHRSADDITERLKCNFKVWHSLVGLDDLTAVETVRKDEVDIIFDLSGHTNHNRLDLFCHRLAPVQIGWIGYPNTTGLRAIDYRLTDEIVDPQGVADALHTERLIRLPAPFLCFSPPWHDVPILSAPARRGRSLTFGSFNARVKIGDECVRLWSRVLAAVPDSRMLIKSGNGLEEDAARDELRQRFVAEGIAADRIEIHGAQPDDVAHLSLYGSVDVCLDAYPYNGTTTTCEALWMGVPVVTLSGDSHASRVGRSLMTSIGLEELVASGIDDFVAIAAALAADLPRREDLRHTMRQRLLDSPLMDAQRMAKNLTEVLRELWQAHCAEEGVPRVSTDRQDLAENFGAVPVTMGEATDVGAGLGFELYSRSGLIHILPPTPRSMSTYVFLEQQQWFELDVNYLCRVAKAGDRVIDIGANVGAYTVPFAARVGSTGQVLAYEPEQATRAYLEASLAANGLTNCIVRPYALSSVAGTAVMILGESSEFNALALEPADKEGGNGVAVEVTTLDQEMSEMDWRHVAIVKMDAEGAESRILAGGCGFFARYSPLVMFEVKNADKVTADLRWTFLAMGYRIFRLCGDGEYLVPVSDNEALDPFTLNLYAAKPDRVAKLAQLGLLASGAACEQLDPAQRSTAVEAYCRLPLAVEFDIQTEDIRASAVGDALISYSAYRYGDLPVEQRHAALYHAHARLSVLENSALSLTRAVFLARICFSLGARRDGLLFLKKAANYLAEGATVDEPFWPALDRYLENCQGADVQHWMQCQIEESFEIWNAHTSVCALADFPKLDRLARSDLASPEMRRRLLLLSAREGRDVSEISDLLGEDDPGTIAHIWSAAGFEFLSKCYSDKSA